MNIYLFLKIKINYKNVYKYNSAKIKMSELGMFHHYVENSFLKAGVMLENENFRGADETRINLIGQLRKIENGNQIITQYISKLSATEWRNPVNLNRLLREYENQFEGLKVIPSLHN